MKKMSRLLCICLTCTLLLSTMCFSAASAEQEVVELDMFINMPWFFTDAFEGLIPEVITEKTGVKLNVTRAVDNRQLGLMIASGNLPDLVFTDSELERLSNPKYAYSYNELIEQYCPDWEVNELDKVNALAYSTDGNYYFIKNCFSSPDEWAESAGIPQIPVMAVRTDILEALGNPDLNTLDDLVNVLGMVKEQYPDLVPLGFHMGNYLLTNIRIALGMGDKDFMELDDGTIITFVNHPAYKDFCKFVNNLYRNDLIMADNFAMDDAERKALMQNAQCFAWVGFTQGELYRYGQMSKTVDPNAEWAEWKVLTNGDSTKLGRSYITSNGWAGTVITKDCKNPEAAIKLMQYLFSPEGGRLGQWGREGIDWVMGDDGFPVFSEEFLAAAADENVLYGKYNVGFYMGTSGADEATGRIGQIPADYRAVYESFKDIIYVCPWYGYAEPKGDSLEKQILTKIRDLKESAEVTIFLSESDDEFEANYEQFVNDCKTIGVEQLEAYMNEQVPAARSLYGGE